MALYEHRRQPGLLLLILLSGIDATVGSGVNIRSYYAPTPCDAGVIASGFPFPWHYAWYSYLIYARIPDCPYYFQTAVFGITLFFLFDTLFYCAIMLAILGLYRAFKQAPSRSQRHLSSLVLDLESGTRRKTQERLAHRKTAANSLSTRDMIRSIGDSVPSFPFIHGISTVAWHLVHMAIGFSEPSILTASVKTGQPQLGQRGRIGFDLRTRQPFISRRK